MILPPLSKDWEYDSLFYIPVTPAASSLLYKFLPFYLIVDCPCKEQGPFQLEIFYGSVLLLATVNPCTAELVSK